MASLETIVALLFVLFALNVGLPRLVDSATRPTRRDGTTPADQTYRSLA